jgi:hypothetical protein
LIFVLLKGTHSKQLILLVRSNCLPFTQILHGRCLPHLLHSLAIIEGIFHFDTFIIGKKINFY